MNPSQDDKKKYLLELINNCRRYCEKMVGEERNPLLEELKKIEDILDGVHILPKIDS